MISLSQYRAAIGSWHALTSVSCTDVHSRCAGPFTFNLIYSNYLHVFSAMYCIYGTTAIHGSLLYICLLLLIASGDIHPNPGPGGPLSDGVRLCHVNARSLLKPGRLDEFYLELYCLHHFDLIGVSESHLSETIPDNDIYIPNYTTFRRDRNRHGGGVALYVHERLSSSRRPDLESRHIEMLWVELKLPNHNVLVGVCYRPPNQSSEDINVFLECLHDSIASIQGSANQSIVLLGDFNDRCVTWDSDHRDSELGLKLVNLVNSLNMFQLIQSPTRNNHLLDLLITDSPGYFTTVDILNPIDGLDHCIIYGTLNKTNPRQRAINEKSGSTILATIFTLTTCFS